MTGCIQRVLERLDENLWTVLFQLTMVMSVHMFIQDICDV